jgi:hypothetical protein
MALKERLLREKNQKAMSPREKVDYLKKRSEKQMRNERIIRKKLKASKAISKENESLLPLRR